MCAPITMNRQILVRFRQHVRLASLSNFLAKISFEIRTNNNAAAS